MERRSDRSETADNARSQTIVDPRTSLALWLRAGRAQRGMSLDDVARVTKIQPKILERLERGTVEGLPADVFVRGFVRSVARCVGLDEDEALRRYAACSGGPAIPAARAMIEVMAELAPLTVARAAAQVDVELASGSLRDLPRVADEPAASAQRPSKKKRRGKGRKRRRMATGTPVGASPVIAEDDGPELSGPIAVAVGSRPIPVVTVSEEIPAVRGSEEIPAVAVSELMQDEIAPPIDPVAPPIDDEPIVTEPWKPKMPTVIASSQPWRRPPVPATAPSSVVPSLVIDDADPDGAEQVLEEREAAKAVMTSAQRRSFLPPILLDREDRGARQGGLTLAVIILLIAATLTLSYLMRRPSSSGDGVTERAAPALRIG